jgi:hypothetical protein
VQKIENHNKSKKKSCDTAQNKQGLVIFQVTFATKTSKETPKE